MAKPVPKNMCLGCKISCCQFLIPLTSYDIARIMQQEGKRPEDFMVALEDTEHEWEDSFRVLGRRYRFVMKARGTGHCVFHDREGRLKCKIEDSKPAICLAYPMELANGKPSLRLDAVCPAENRKIAARAGKMTKKVLEDGKWEIERYREMVTDWNAHAIGNETPDQFFNFALREMSHERTFAGSMRRKIRRMLAHWLVRPGSIPHHLYSKRR